MAGQTINVSILADTKQFSGAMKTVSGSLADFGRPLQSIGAGVKGLGQGLTNWITKPAIGAAAAGAGIVAAFGWKRLVGLDTAKGQLRGLGYQGKQLDAVMAQVGKGVDNTTLSMADGAQIAAAGLATNNLALEDTEAYLKRVANISAAYPVEAAHASRLLNNVLLKGTVTWGDLSQMQENQIPVVAALAEHYGVAGDEIMKMAQDGKIGVEDLNEALDKTAGAAAEEYAKTWEGITANIRSNLGKIGAAVLGTSFDIIKEQAAGFLELLRSDSWMEVGKTIGVYLGNAISTLIERVSAAVSWWQNLDDRTKSIILSLAGFAVTIGPILMAIGSLISAVGGAVMWVSKMWQAMVLLKGAVAVISGPILLVVAAVAALVAGLVYFFTQTETGQAIWEKVWSAIQTAAAFVVDWFMGTALPVLQEAWAGIQAAAQVVAEWFTGTLVPALQVAWEAIQTAAQVVADWFMGTLVPALTTAWETIRDVATAAADWFMTHVGPVIAAAGDLIMAVWERMQQAGEFLGTILSAAWALMGQAWDALMGYISSAWDTIGGPVMATIETVVNVLKGVWQVAWSAISTYLVAAWQIIRTTVETALAVVSSIIRAVTAAIRGDWSAAWGHVKDALSSAWEGMKSIVRIATDALKSIVRIAMDAIKAAMDRVWSRIKTAVSDAWEAVKRTTTTKIGEVVSFVREMPGKIRSALGNLSSLLSDAGRQIIDGFIGSIRAGFDRVKGEFSKLTGMIPSWKGPPGRDKTLLKGAGQLIIQGFIDGLESQYSAVRSSLSGLTDDVAHTPFEAPTATTAAHAPPAARKPTQEPALAAALAAIDDLRGRELSLSQESLDYLADRFYAAMRQAGREQINHLVTASRARG